MQFYLSVDGSGRALRIGFKVSLVLLRSYAAWGVVLVLGIVASRLQAQAVAPNSGTVGQATVSSFVNDIEPIFTRLGCNQGACHGKGAGQNGFRLSLRAYAPELDHEYLTREAAGRRVNLAVPEASLFLKKPLGEVPHEGGKILRPETREYLALLEWVRAGAPGPLAQEATVRRLEIVPSKRVMKSGEEQQLLVWAEYSDGRKRDVTWLTLFYANDASVATVTSAGLVHADRPGETAIRVTFQGQVAAGMITVPNKKPVRSELLAQRNNFIDDHVFDKLAALRIEPSSLCSDATFIRRAYLDTIGVLPTASEIGNFLASPLPHKRSDLINMLLEREEYIDYQTLLLCDLLQNRKESDHDVRGAKEVKAFYDYLWDQVAMDRAWNELARDIMTVQGKTADKPAIGYFIVNVGEVREADQSPVVASVAQTFLGTRIGCAKCHNHPLERYTQDDYYHFAAFFSRIKFKRVESKKGSTALQVGAADKRQADGAVGVVQPRTGKFLKPQTLDGAAPAVNAGQDPREPLARWMTDPTNESFAGAMVNRLWAQFFSVGLVEPIDDLRASNPPSNPELWKALVKEFVDSGFDRKHVMRLILNSRTYQRDSATRSGNETDRRFYSHYYARRLPAEVLLDALCQSTGVSESYPDYPAGMRAVQLPDTQVKSYFLSLFGKSERVSACACERSGDVTMPQLMHLQNGDSVIAKISNPKGRLAELLRSRTSDAEITEELFMSSLARLPSEGEREQIRSELHSGDPREVVFRDLYWALLNAKEFSFNH